jgi:hypothetical protein
MLTFSFSNKHFETTSGASVMTRVLAILVPACYLCVKMNVEEVRDEMHAIHAKIYCLLAVMFFALMPLSRSHMCVRTHFVAGWHEYDSDGCAWRPSKHGLHSDM